MKIAIISHTQHYINDKGTVVGWGATVKELNNLLLIADSIIHIAPLHSETAPASALAYVSNKIQFVSLKPSGGKGLNKLSILFNAPYNLYKIHKTLKNVDYTQFRSPTGMGIYVLPYLKFFKKKHWIKYAGNWKDSKMPFGNMLQKKWLKKATLLSTKVTVNGNWENERGNIIPFENPCLDQKDRTLGKTNCATKTNHEQINFCFVGALNYHKGVDKILDAFRKIESNKIGEIHFVGGGEDKENFTQKSKSINYKVVFHGFLPKDSIQNIYIKCHFIILPSQSEGFPKVIGEAMNFGCIPIVSNVSCIGQYIQNNCNGFLIDPITVENIKEEIEKSLLLKNSDFENYIKINYELAKKFTYDYYLQQIQNKILNKE